MSKTKVIFLHINKCGGSSLRHMLMSEYSWCEIAPVPVRPFTFTFPYPVIRGTTEIEYQEILWPDDFRNYKLVMGHYDWRVTKKLPDWKIMTVLRDPVRQLLSHYYFIERARDQYGDLWEEIGPMGFSGWVRSKHVMPFLNDQTRVLSGGWVYPVEDEQKRAMYGQEANYTRAISNLCNLRMTFGLLERLDESVKLFNHAFGWQLPEPIHVNKAQVNTDDIDLDKSTIDYVKQLQHKDMRLYKAAQDTFNRQIQKFAND